MESHNFNILEEKVKVAIAEIKRLTSEKNELASKIKNNDETEVVQVSVISDAKGKKIADKVDEMIAIIDSL